jgi:hypothetical protein
MSRLEAVVAAPLFPHRLQGSVPAHGGEAELRMFVESGGLDADLSAAAVLLRVFGDAAGRGLFGPEAHVEVAAIEAYRPGLACIPMRVAGISLGTFRVLVQLLDAWRAGAESSLSVHLQTARSEAELVDLPRVLVVDYPRATGASDFEVRRLRDEENAKDPVIRLRFGRALRDSEYDTVVSTFELWDELVLRGGLSAPICDPASPVPSQTYMAAATTAEHVLYGDVASSAAFDAVVNGSRYLHAHVCPLMALEIE